MPAEPAARRPHFALVLIAAALSGSAVGPFAAGPLRAPLAAGQALAMPLQTLLWRTADYLRRYEKTMATVVLEEQYVQLLKRWGMPPKTPDAERLAWLPGDGMPERRDVNVYDRRQTRADLLLVQLPDSRWWAFRDIFELNGRQQGNREDRLRKLFLEGTEDSRRQLHRINQASADLNLGKFYREINLPTVGLMILQSAQQPRFEFRARGTDKVGDVSCQVVSFKETARPTLVRTFEQRDVPLSGNVCIDGDGVVWRTRIELEGRFTARGAIEVIYGPHERVDVLVPATMWEWYLPQQQDDRRGPTFIEALATYSNLRQFTVSATENPK